MKKVTCMVLLLIAALTLFGCGGSKTMTSTDAGDIPKWYLNVPEDNANYLFAANTAVSKDMQLARDKAITGARAELSRQIEAKVDGLQKRFDEEVGVDENAELLQQFTQAAKVVSSNVLNGSRVEESSILQEGEMYRVYILASYPIGAANAALMEQIQNQKNMYTRFRSSETFKELEQEVEKYNEWKKTQQAGNP